MRDAARIRAFRAFRAEGVARCRAGRGGVSARERRDRDRGLGRDGAPWNAASAALLARDAGGETLLDAGPSAWITGASRLLGDSTGAILPPAGSVAVFAVLVVLGAARWRDVRQRAKLIAFFAVAYSGWCATSMTPRFFLAPLIALGPLAAAAVELVASRVRGPLARSVRSALAACAATLALVGWTASLDGFFGARALPPRAVLADRRVLVQRALDLAGAEVAMASALPADARVLMVGEARLAFMPRRALVSSALDPPLVGALLGDARVADDIPRLLAPHATHVLVNWREWDRWRQHYACDERIGLDRAEALRAWLERQPAVVRVGSVVVVAISPGETGSGSVSFDSRPRLGLETGGRGGGGTYSVAGASGCAPTPLSGWGDLTDPDPVFHVPSRVKQSQAQRIQRTRAAASQRAHSSIAMR